jgi:hypothetical protein
MMKLSELKAKLQREPFRPFVIDLQSGRQVRVESEAHIKLPPDGFDVVIVFGTDGLVHHLPLDSIVTVAGR